MLLVSHTISNVNQISIKCQRFTRTDNFILLEESFIQLIFAGVVQYYLKIDDVSQLCDIRTNEMKGQEKRLQDICMTDRIA